MTAFSEHERRARLAADIVEHIRFEVDREGARVVDERGEDVGSIYAAITTYAARDVLSRNLASFLVARGWRRS